MKTHTQFKRGVENDRMRRSMISRAFTSLLVILLLLPVNIGVIAAEDVNEPISEPAIAVLQPDSQWQASVFGDVGGQDKITSANFSIAEDEQGTIQMKSLNDRGKISSTTDGIAYLYQSVPLDRDFEFSATATVNSIADHNQASFGIMLRNTVYDYVHGADYAKDDYLAVGALDKKIKLFSRLNTVQAKQDLAEQLSIPTAGSSYQLTVKKMSNVFVVTVNDQSYVMDNYASDVSYIGLFTARNADITYENVQLAIVSEEQPELGELQFYSFGGNTSEEKNPEPVINEAGVYTLEASGGKVASGDEGISFLAYELPASASFTLEATATVDAFNSNTAISTPNQKSFGLMLRDTVGEHRSTATATSNYVAVGALDTVIKGFYKSGVVDGSGGTQAKLNAYAAANAPTANEVYQLKIERNQDSYALSVNGESQLVNAEHLFSEQLYAGVYTARDAKITFSNIMLKIDTAAVQAVQLDASAMKTTYRLQEELDLTGLIVTAVRSDGSEIELSGADYVVTGFDSSESGSKELTIHYKGRTAKLPYEVAALQVTSLDIVYEPAITSYYMGDELQLQGLTVEANYEAGYMYRELTPELYTIVVQDQQYDGYGYNERGEKHRFTTAGSYIVSVVSAENEAVRAEFTVQVADASLTRLEITQQPSKTTYFIDDPLQLDGLMVYGHHSDGSRQRIAREELTISDFNTAVAGLQELTITYRGQSTTLSLMVKEKEAVALAITNYPKTTYRLGEELDLSQLKLAIAYDSGDLEAIAEDGYSIDVSAYQANAAGQYKLIITSNHIALPALELLVHVRDDAPIQWKSIRFGQSTSSNNNTVEVDEQGVVTLKAIGGSAGKVTGDHDGISFYYAELDALEDNFELSADIKVVEYAKSPDHDGQESFGIMARDAIGTANDSSVFASNIAAIGGYSGGTRNPNGTQLFVRTGIESPDGSGSEGIRALMLQEERPSLQNTYPAQTYRLTLSKTNSGFTGKLNDNEPVTFYTPDILNVQDNKMYVGFYAARLATIEVHNIELKVTSAASDAPKVEPPLTPLEPAVELVSLLQTSTTEQYELKVKANTAGSLTIKQGKEIIASDMPVEANQLVTQATNLAAGNNRFTVSFTPGDMEYLTSYNTIVENYTVTVKQYTGDIYVAPDGTPEGEGSIVSPLDLDTAISYIAPGQTIIVQDGHYVRNRKLNIEKYNDGTAEAVKTLKAADGARPVIDFDKKSEGVILSGSYWHISGIDFTRSAGNTKGFTVGGSHNIIELCRFYEHGDTGLQISRTDDATDIADWPSYNLILNSTSFANRDPSDNNADGFAAKLTSGVGNVFRGAIAYNNVDDGWDLYTKSGSGAIGAVTIEDSIAFNNGYPMGSTELKGDGNGFKLGGEGIHVPHVIRNSIAFHNGTAGFTSNSNPGVIAYNNIGFNNPKGNIVFTTYSQITPDFTIDGFVSFATQHIARDQVPEAATAPNNYFNDGTRFVNSTGALIAASNFKSLEAPLEIARDDEGNIELGDFLSFIAPVNNVDPGQPGNPSTPISESDPEPITYVKLNGTIVDGTVTGEMTSEQAIAAISAMNKQAARKITIALGSGTAQAEKVYQLKLPAHLFSASEEPYYIELITPVGSIVMPGLAFHSMFDQAAGHDLDQTIGAASLASGAESQAQAKDRLNSRSNNESNNGSNQASDNELTIQIRDVSTEAQASQQPDEERARPIVAFDLYWNGQLLSRELSIPSLQLFIPYTPSAEEATRPGKLTIWSIGNDGASAPIPNAYYDEKAKGMSWKTDQPGKFAVVPGSKTFSDTPDTHWAHEAISTLAAKGVINGINERQFAPNEAVTRADFIVMLMRALGLTAADTDTSSELAAGTISQFTDVSTAAYYYEAIAAAQQLGIINGYPSGEFKPEQEIERQEMAVMAYKAIEKVAELKLNLVKDNGALAQYSDASMVANYAKAILSTLVEHGIIQGYNEKLAARSATTRAEAAVFIERLVFQRY